MPRRGVAMLRRALMSVLLLLLTVASGRALDESPPAGSTLILLVHTHHTASHALCEALAKLSCVHAHCGEPVLDEAQAVGMVTASNKPYAVSIYGNNMVVGASTEPWFKRWIAAGRAQFLFQVRLDMMRWSLSLYCKHAACPEGGGGDPQFHHTIATTTHPFDVDEILPMIARTEVMNMWHQIVNCYMAPTLPNGNKHLVFTEDLFRSELVVDGADRVSSYMRWIMHELVGADCDCTWHEDLLPASGGNVVQKVHSDDIRTYVSNADAVEQLFGTPPWSDSTFEGMVVSWDETGRIPGASSVLPLQRWDPDWDAFYPARPPSPPSLPFDYGCPNQCHAGENACSRGICIMQCDSCRLQFRWPQPPPSPPRIPTPRASLSTTPPKPQPQPPPRPSPPLMPYHSETTTTDASLVAPVFLASFVAVCLALSYVHRDRGREQRKNAIAARSAIRQAVEWHGDPAPAPADSNARAAARGAARAATIRAAAAAAATLHQEATKKRRGTGKKSGPKFASLDESDDDEGDHDRATGVDMEMESTPAAAAAPARPQLESWVASLD